MIQRLRPIGTGFGIIIDKATLDRLKIGPETELDVTADGERLIISPVRGPGGAPRRRKADTEGDGG